MEYTKSLTARILNELGAWVKEGDDVIAEIRRLKNLDKGFRTPIGVANTGSATMDGIHFLPVLVAVCDDGTVWEWSNDFKEWRQSESIPGTKADNGNG